MSGDVKNTTNKQTQNRLATLQRDINELKIQVKVLRVAIDKLKRSDNANGSA